jgi:hypothetical protein
MASMAEVTGCIRALLAEEMGFEQVDKASSIDRQTVDGKPN